MNEFKTYGYHVTSKNNLQSIYRNGLIPNIPPDSPGEINAIFLFKTKEDAKMALYQWLGERIDDFEEETGIPYEEVLLTIDLSGLEEYLIDTVEYEWACLIKISPDRIINEEKI